VSTTADVVIVGAGVVGLALADSWLARHPGDSVILVDKESELGMHASGRNSGVLHAGFYYAPDSLKAKLTRDGNRLLKEFCSERNVPVRETGKVVVTTSGDQLPALEQLFQRGQANGVKLEQIDEAQLFELEPLARTHERALWSPTTAVADPVKVVQALAQRVVERGGVLRLGASVVGIESRKVLLSDSETISFGHLINAAGLYADTIAHWCGVGLEYKMLPFKGLYWYGNWEPGRLQRHVYPVPDPRNPFLGTHVTVTVDGRAKVGPTAIPSLWREDYGGVANFSAAEMARIIRLYPGFISSKHHNVWNLMRTELPKYSRKKLLAEAARLVPAVNSQDFHQKGRPGVRAQLLHVPTGRLEMDFVVHHGVYSTHLLNAVSPAWTSSLAVADYVVTGIEAERQSR
jgi:L-2-hydroxyglutarate oxidase LhgO